MPGQRAPDWGVGHYERTAEVLLPAARVLVQAAEPQAGERVLDLGSGTGNAAILAAAAGSLVTAVDPSQRLLDVAQRTAADQGLDLTCLVGDAAHVPLPDSSVDCVVSSFGIIFAPDADAAAAEIARVLIADGRLLFTAWLPGGAAGALSAAAQDLVRTALGAAPPPPGLAWHDPSAVAALFSEHAMHVEQRGRHSLVFSASSPQAYLDTELSSHPLAVTALQVLRERGVDEVGRDRLLQVAIAENEDPRAFRSTARYVVMAGRRDVAAGR